MKIDRHHKRLNSITSCYVTSPTKCNCCNEEYVYERMYSVKRWGINETVHTCYYCQNCMHSKEDVLHEIDTDTGEGIAYVDSFGHYPEKDYTKIRKWINSLPDPNGKPRILV